MNSSVLGFLQGCTLMLLFTYAPTLHAQQAIEDLNIGSMIQAIDEDGIFVDSDYYNWGPSIIKDQEGVYHLFYSRWLRKYSFFGWLTHSEVAHATSSSPSGPWKYHSTALKNRNDEKWDAITAHNPKIKYFEGKYFLYYIATNDGGNNFSEQQIEEIAQVGNRHPSRKVLRNNMRTGVAVSNSIYGPWERMDKALLEPTGPITTVCVNPAIDKDKKGLYHLIIKGDKPNETRFIRNQAIALANSPLGPFTIQDQPVIGNLDTEDVSMWYDENQDRFYAVFHAHTFIGMMSSKDGLNWTKAKHYKLTGKQLLLADGSYLQPDRMERPFVYEENGLPKVLSLAIKKGNDSFIVFIPLEPQD